MSCELKQVPDKPHPPRLRVFLEGLGRSTEVTDRFYELQEQGLLWEEVSAIIKRENSLMRKFFKLVKSVMIKDRK